MRRAMQSLCLALPALLLGSGMACAQPYPYKPIRIIVPYPAGSGTEFTAREVAQLFTKALGQQVVIDTRPGAGATLGHALAAKAAPDGYTLLLATAGGLSTGPALIGNKIPYDPLKDFAPIGLATYVPYALAVTAGLPARSVKELVDLAKASPGKLNVASPGVGTPNHLGAAQLMTLTGIELVHVPYKGSSLALTDVIAGNVQMVITGMLQLLPYHQAGKLRILGVGHMQRVKAYPDIPAINESIPGYYNTGWWGIAGPAALPKPIIDKLSAIMIAGLAQPDVAQRFDRNGLEVASSTPQGLRSLIESDLNLWRRIIKEAKISVDVLP